MDGCSETLVGLTEASRGYRANDNGLYLLPLKTQVFPVGWIEKQPVTWY